MSMVQHGRAAADLRGPGDDDGRMNTEVAPARRIERMLRTEPVLWLSTVRPDGGPHLVPIWFSWDGREILIASKPDAQKVRNLRANPTAMLALGEAEDDFDVGLIEGRAELVDAPAAGWLPAAHLAKYRAEMARLDLGSDEFLATYSQVIRIRPTRFLPWHGRTVPAEAAAAVPAPASFPRRVAARLAGRFRSRLPFPASATVAATAA
jgi:PPOX class probable F420-dependent enzyme